MSTFVVPSQYNQCGYEIISTSNQTICQLWRVLQDKCDYGSLLYLDWGGATKTQEDLIIFNKLLEVFPWLRGFISNVHIYQKIINPHLRRLVLLLYTGEHDKLSWMDFGFLHSLCKTDQEALRTLTRHFPFLLTY